jgi:histidinol-phosphatase
MPPRLFLFIAVASPLPVFPGFVNLFTRRRGSTLPDLKPMDWLAILDDIGRIAGNTALKYYRSRLTVTIKSDGSPVTQADVETERVVRAWIRQRFPEDEVIGEEEGESLHGSSSRRWVIDPLDGTKSFVAGVPLWGTMIGVLDGEDVIAGVVNCAAAEEMTVAAVGAGCWHNGLRCTVSAVAQLHHATILATDDRFGGNRERQAKWSALAGRAHLARTWGDCFGYVLLATGRADVMVDDRLSLWDYAPLVPLVREAGGVLTDWRGNDSFGADAIATNAALDAAVRGILRESDPA